MSWKYGGTIVEILWRYCGKYGRNIMEISWKICWKYYGDIVENMVEILWRYRGKYGGLWLQPWCDHKPLILGQSASQSSTLLNLSSFAFLT